MIYKLDQIFVIVPNTPCRLVDFPTAVENSTENSLWEAPELVRLPSDDVIFRLPWDDIIFNPSVNIIGLNDELVCFMPHNQPRWTTFMLWLSCHHTEIYTFLFKALCTSV